MEIQNGRLLTAMDLILILLQVFFMQIPCQSFSCAKRMGFKGRLITLAIGVKNTRSH